MINQEEQKIICKFCHNPHEIYYVTYCNAGGKWQDAYLCNSCIEELKNDYAEIGIVEKQ